MPEHGDIAICIDCYEVSVWTESGDGLIMRVPTPTEATELYARPAVMSVRAAMKFAAASAGHRVKPKKGRRG